MLRPHRANSRRNAIHRWLLPLSRLCLLLAIVLLPVEMRAGASEAHPHSLLQLLLDAADGTIDHHHGSAAEQPRADHGHAAHGDGECVINPDVPAVEETGQAGGAPMLATLVLLLIVPAPSGSLWSGQRAWRSHPPATEPPPPRRGRPLDNVNTP